MAGNVQRTGFSGTTAGPARATKRVRQVEHMMDEGRQLQQDLFNLTKKRLGGIFVVPDVRAETESGCSRGAMDSRHVLGHAKS